MNVIGKDDYAGICDAKGCDNTSEVAISLYGVKPDLHICGECLKKLAVSIGIYYKEKKKNG